MMRTPVADLSGEAIEAVLDEAKGADRRRRGWPGSRCAPA